jgi:hypothetical protein
MTSWVEAIYSCSDEAPVFLEQELNRLYGIRYSWLPYFRLYGSWDQVRAYVASRAGVAVAVFLFRCENGRAVVLNEGMKLSQEDVNRFTSYLFRNHESLSVVAFNYVEADGHRFAFPFQRAACGQDSVLELPATAEAYTASLARGTRLTLTRRLERIRRELPGFAFAVYEKQDVPVQIIRELIRLERVRQARKGQVSQVDATEEERIIAYVALCGFVSAATRDGRVCAGAITYRHGSNFTARMLAHDPDCGGYRLGFVCAYLTICACIMAGDSRYFYFGWGQNDYKHHLGGAERQLVNLSLFRSRLHVLGNAGTALGVLVDDCAFRLRRLLETWRGKGALRTLAAGALITAGRWLRTAKR